MSQKYDTAREGNEELDELDFLNRCDSLPTDDCLDLDGGGFGGGDRGDETWLMASAHRPHRLAPEPSPQVTAAAAALGGSADPTPAAPLHKRRGGTATGTSASHQQQQQSLRRHSSLIHAKHTNGQPCSPQSPLTATKDTFPSKSQTKGGPPRTAGTSPTTSAVAPPPKRSPSSSATTPPPLVMSRSPSQANMVALSSATPQPRRQLFHTGHPSGEKDRGPSAGMRPTHHPGGATTARDLVSSSRRASTHRLDASRSHRSCSAGDSSPQPSRQGGLTAVKRNSSQMLHHAMQQGSEAAAPTSAVTALHNKRTSSSPTPGRSVITSGKAHEHGVVVLSLQSSSAAHRTSSAMPHAPLRSTSKPPMSSERRGASGVAGECVNRSPQQRALSAGRGGRSPSLGEVSSVRLTATDSAARIMPQLSYHSEVSPRARQQRAAGASTPPEGETARRMSSTSKKRAMLEDSVHDGKPSTANSSAKLPRDASALRSAVPPAPSAGARCVSPLPPAVALLHQPAGINNSGATARERSATASQTSFGETHDVPTGTAAHDDIVVVFTLESPQDVRAPHNGHDIDVHVSLLPCTADVEATTVGTKAADQAEARRIEQQSPTALHRSDAESLQTQSEPSSAATLQPAQQPAQHQTDDSAFPSSIATPRRGTEPLSGDDIGQQVVEPLASEDIMQRKAAPIVALLPPVSRPVQHNEQHVDSTQSASINEQYPVSGATSIHSAVTAIPTERVGAGGSRDSNNCCTIM
jgi:hypothetical protein